MVMMKMAKCDDDKAVFCDADILKPATCIDDDLYIRHEFPDMRVPIKDEFRPETGTEPLTP